MTSGSFMIGFMLIHRNNGQKDFPPTRLHGTLRKERGYDDQGPITNTTTTGPLTGMVAGYVPPSPLLVPPK